MKSHIKVLLSCPPSSSYAADWWKTVAQAPGAYSFLTKLSLEIQCFTSSQRSGEFYVPSPQTISGTGMKISKQSLGEGCETTPLFSQFSECWAIAT